jgi:2-polyprenyl-3-methyl-5-hydroxy-6-metoxy-1,4-benzoquinol methylase
VTRIIAQWEARIPGSLRWKEAVDERLVAQTAVALDMLFESRAVDELKVGHDNADYHRNRIRDADYRFDEVETTVSLAYSVRHPGLGGRAYGEALFDKWYALGAIRSGMQILEVGCGTGRLARSFLDAFAKRMPEAYANARYVMFDVAPVLAASQRDLTVAHAERIALVTGNIETHVFHEQFDLVIANEMIADLSVEAVDKSRPEAGLHS